MIRPICLALLVFLVACRPESVPTHPAAPTSPAPASSTAPSVAPSATSSPTVAQLIYPYTIDGLRHHQFQSGVIKIISTLSKTDIYTSYLISYPSDGLRITGVMQIPAQG
ncbi:MAG TPA: hypothetical protein VF784_15690, partial [Anaerolineales bacterium]